jgi:hypothetical protein
MFSNVHFYHRITRKMVVAFGTLFNNIRLVRYNKAGTTEIERIIVPLQYAQKEKFYQRITQDPELTKEVQMTLPRMSFELTAITYDPSRKRNLFSESFSADSNTTIKIVRTTPYNFEFTLYIYVRNTEDGTQIVEQILPYFNPDYNLTLDMVGLADQKVDVPFILQNINYNVEDIGDGETTRVLVWSLTFTAKGYMFGPITSANVIRKVTANTYNMVTADTQESQRLLYTANTGFGTFKIGELVYQGESLSAANSTAFVDAWDPTSYRLVVSDVSGILKVGQNITGAISNASYNITSFGVNDYQLFKLQVTPDPITANAQTAFGFDEIIQYAPNIT